MLLGGEDAAARSFMEESLSMVILQEQCLASLGRVEQGRVLIGTV